MPSDAHDDGIRKTVLPEAGDAPTSRRRVAASLLRLAIAATILVYLFHTIPLSRVRAVLEHADLAWIVVAFLLALLTQMSMAMRLRILANAYALLLTTFDVLEINLSTRFYSLFLPGGGVTATAVRVCKLARFRKSYGGAIAAIALDRVITTLTMCFVGVLFGCVAWRPGQSVWLLIMAIATLTLATPLVWLYAQRNQRSALEDRAAACGRFESIKRITAAIMPIPRSRWTRVLGWSLLAHVIGTLEYVALAQSLSVELGFASLGWLRSVMLFAALIPITVSGLGLREGAALLVLLAYGVSPDMALAFSLMVFAVSHVALGLLGGLLEALWQRPRQPKKRGVDQSEI